MIKRLLLRMLGLLLAAVAVPPAAVSLLKACPFPVARAFGAFFQPVWLWKWVWGWMPALQFPWQTWADILWSLPGLVALALLGVGLAMAFGPSNGKPRKKWEDEP